MSDKTAFRTVVALSVLVVALVVALNRRFLPAPATFPGWVYTLPSINASINGACAALLVASLVAIKQRRVTLHRRLNLTTFAGSAAFLVCYVIYHWLVPETRFPSDHPLRPVYLALLASHIVLAALVLPLVLLAFWFGLRADLPRHRRVVRLAYPIWLYVCVTGPVVYLMISPYYRHG